MHFRGPLAAWRHAQSQTARRPIQNMKNQEQYR